MNQQIENFEEFIKQVLGHLNKIEDDKAKCMVAIWRIEDGQIYLNRSTWDYPTGEFDRSIGMLVEDLTADRSILDASPTIPLPTANLDLEAMKEV